jgi:cell division ATPase FtsA
LSSLFDLFVTQLGVKSINVYPASLAVLYYYGVTDGIVYDIGDTVTDITTVNDRHVVSNFRTKLGGNDMTEVLSRKFTIYKYFKTEDREMVRKIKEQYLDVYETNTEVELDIDGSVYTYRAEDFDDCVNVLFYSDIVEKVEEGLIVNEGNVYLAGGGAKIPKVHDEFNSLNKEDYRVCDILAWRGFRKLIV